MLSMNKNMNYDATSKITGADGNEVIIFNMNASVNDNSVYISKSILNVDLYNENKETADADFAEFESAILENL